VHISALVKNARGSHDVTLATGDSRNSLTVPCREIGFGSGINGGELLMLALATCYCNDLTGKQRVSALGSSRLRSLPAPTSRASASPPVISVTGPGSLPLLRTPTLLDYFARRTQSLKFTTPSVRASGSPSNLGVRVVPSNNRWRGPIDVATQS